VTVLSTGAFVAPIRDLVEGTRRVREGDLGTRVPLVSDDELGVLAESFNEMTADLQRSRERLVTAREEERRRLRRDLHDGLGPALAGISMRLEAAAELVQDDPAAARALLDELRLETAGSVADIRRVVYELRPPQLDELGLAGAIEEHAARVAPGTPRIHVDARLGAGALPAAVEVAAFRIVQEALVNAIRHSGARNCSVRLERDRELEVVVRDDGAGIPDGHPAGVGLGSMRERAAELGGTCTFEPARGGGTIVRARLPLSAQQVAHDEAENGRGGHLAADLLEGVGDDGDRDNGEHGPGGDGLGGADDLGRRVSEHRAADHGGERQR
jgi:signal transduction histidine kinase